MSAVLRDRVAIVTGGSGSIGRAICRRLGELGADVAVHYYRSAAEADSVVEGLTAAGCRARAVGADLAEPGGAEALMEDARRQLGRVSILINNAAIQPLERFGDISPNELARMLATNVGGPFRLIQLFAEQTPAGADSSVVNIASIEGTRPALSHSHYSVSKAALIMATRAAALELGPQGVRVNSVSPGLIHHEGLETEWPDGVSRWQRAAPLERLGTTEDVANAVAFLASPEAGWITGHDLVVDGGMSARPGW